MSSQPDTDEFRSSTPRHRLEGAMQEVAEYRRDLIRNQQLNNDRDPNLLKGFHSAIIRYYIELAVYSDEPALKDFWKDAKLWRDDRGEWLTGIDNIRGWMNRYRSAEISRPGLGRGKKSIPIRDTMPPVKALRASEVLDKAAKKLGLTIPVEDVTERPYDDWRDEFEDGVYHSPEDVENPAKEEFLS